MQANIAGFDHVFAYLVLHLENLVFVNPGIAAMLDAYHVNTIRSSCHRVSNPFSIHICQECNKYIAHFTISAVSTIQLNVQCVQYYSIYQIIPRPGIWPNEPLKEVYTRAVNPYQTDNIKLEVVNIELQS